MEAEKAATSPAAAPAVVTGVTPVQPTPTPVQPTPAAAARGDNPTPAGESPASVPAVAQAPAMGAEAVPGSAGPPKKKRGRPRKYAPDGSVLALSPMPISASAPAEFPGSKRGRGRPAGSLSKHRIDLDFSGDWASVGGSFIPHIITVPAGEDVTMKIISFSQQGPRAICILSANGAISNVTLRQPDSSGGTLTYEGRFEILSLSGSFMPTESGGARSRSGGMSVSLASPDGRVVGGGVAGLLIAASPVQVVVGSFVPFIPEQKARKPKTDSNTCSMPVATIPASSTDVDDSFILQARPSTTPRPPELTSSFRADTWGVLHPMAETRTSSSTDINVSLPGE